MTATTFRDAAAALAAAFHAGTLFGHVLPDPVTRARRLPWLFAGTLRHCRRHGHVLTDGADAAAGWVPGGRLALGPVDLVRTGLVLTPLRFGPGATLRLERHERPTERRLVDALTPSTGYLWVLGVRPDRQGTGAGGAMLRRVLDDMAAGGHDRCLLRTDDEPNVGFYRRHGFEVVEHCTDLKSGLPAWIMAAPTA
ncbi:MAG TPA: GNAT family N-acetyltransferase [Egicoccus sp.]|nr:GNAT family N-acetyltransferase [Egicoccus sp.]HSK23975.1 GNAT family N-acetyltransferase [Egicoccus sp.]